MKKITKRIRDYTFDWYSEKELLKFFPEAKKIIPEKIREWQKTSEELKNEIREILDKVEQTSKKDFWFYEIYIAKFYLPTLYKYERHILRLRMFLNSSEKRKQFINFSEKIEIAHNYPIYELARDKLDLKPSGKNFVALCPFHDEKTPSFYLYTETNSFYCFGCNQGNDVINLTMALYGLNFKEAVLMLQR